MTQKEKILELFKGGGWVRVQEMNAIAFRYGAIIFNLKKEGYKFQKRKQSFSNLEEWRLVSVEQPKESVRLEMPRFVIDEVAEITPEQFSILDKRLLELKEKHGTINS